MAIREVFTHRVIGYIRRVNRIVTGGVIPHLQPADSAEQRIKRSLSYLVLRVHQLERRIGRPLQQLGLALVALILDLEPHPRVIERHRRQDLPHQRVETAYLDDALVGQSGNIVIHPVLIQQAPP